jgi:hypothetical protein
MKIYNDFLQLQILNYQFFSMPIYLLISERNCSNFEEMFFIRTSFYFSIKIDSGDTGRSVELARFFV